MIHPGPPQIEPGVYPGGVVIHVYDVPSGVLVTTSMSRSLAEASHNAATDADVTVLFARPDRWGVCLVAYDGDTGERFDADDWGAR